MVEAVIFDMDGLMIDTETINYKFFGGFFESRGIELSKRDYCVCFTGRTIDKGLISAKEIYNADYEVEEFFEYFEEHRIEWENQIVPLKPGLIELLEDLKTKNIKLAIATSSGIDRVYKLFKHYDVLKYFDEIICGPDVKHGKPAPDIFLKACEKLNVNVEDAIVLEDSEAGIEAAYNANVPVICIPDMKVPDEKHLNMLAAVLPTLKDVINYLD